MNYRTALDLETFDSILDDDGLSQEQASSRTRRSIAAREAHPNDHKPSLQAATSGMQSPSRHTA